MIVADFNCSVSVLLILADHPLFKYSRSELGEGGRFSIQVFVMAKSNDSTSLFCRRDGDDPPTVRRGEFAVYSGQIAIWQTRRRLRNLTSCNRRNFTKHYFTHRFTGKRLQQINAPSRYIER
jgi:hypothetical protein